MTVAPTDSEPGAADRPPALSASHVLLIPSYNSGRLLRETVSGALAWHRPVWVIIDGSTDGSDQDLEELTPADEPEALWVMRLQRNVGKGAALLHGAREAFADGFTHLLTMDGDGQHQQEALPAFVAATEREPGAMILGRPVFDHTAPAIRVFWRKLANFWARMFTLGECRGDSLFGMRAYPLASFLHAMESTRWARRYDFDGEVAVRLSWLGLPSRNLDTPVRYISAENGGISHFHYVRDNLRLVWAFARLLPATLLRLPGLLIRRLRLALGDEQRAQPGEEPPQQPAAPSVARQLSRSFARPLYRHYTRQKLLTDPLYEGIYQVLRQNTLPLLDVGCGLGLLTAYLRCRGWHSAVVGVDLDGEKIRAARAAAVRRGENGADFHVGDARTAVPDFAGSVALLDILQFLTPRQQGRLLRDLAARVAPGGFFIIRACLNDSTWRYQLNVAADWFARLALWMPSAPVHYPREAMLRGVLEQEGLQGWAEPLWGDTPFNNHLMVFRRPEASETAPE